MQPFLAAIEPFPMQYGIHRLGADAACTVAHLPCKAKALGIIAAAEEAGPVTCAESGGLVKKEQLGPAPPRHHRPPPVAEFTQANDPGRRRPALLQQRL